MGPFEHIVILLSFVYALALTHLLSRIGALIAARSRTRWSGLQALAMANALLNLLINWLALLGFRDQTNWNLLDVAIQLSMAISLYFLCYLVMPEIPTEGPIELESYFWNQRQAFYISFLVVAAISFIDNLEFLKTPNASAALVSNIAVIVLIPPAVLALVNSARVVQWSVGLVLFVGVVILFGATDWRVA